jgi:hypothetical protein
MGPEIVNSPKTPIEHGSKRAVNAVVEYPDGYSIGAVLELIVKHSDSRPQPDDDVKIKVLNYLGTPWRSGYVMIVEYLAGPISQPIGRNVVLKLLDPRYCDIAGGHGLDISISTRQKFYD